MRKRTYEILESAVELLDMIKNEKKTSPSAAVSENRRSGKYEPCR